LLLISTSGKRNDNADEVTIISSQPAIVEATGFIHNENG
jgi:hypothetical protein